MPRFEGKGSFRFKGIKVDDDREKKEGRDDRNLASDPCQYPKLDQSSGGKMDPEALCYGGDWWVDGRSRTPSYPSG